MNTTQLTKLKDFLQIGDSDTTYDDYLIQTYEHVKGFMESELGIVVGVKDVEIKKRDLKGEFQFYLDYYPINSITELNLDGTDITSDVSYEIQDNQIFISPPITGTLFTIKANVGYQEEPIALVPFKVENVLFLMIQFIFQSSYKNNQLKNNILPGNYSFPGYIMELFYSLRF
jgi:hypothetical protein